MFLKILWALVALVLMITYLIPQVVKLKDVALSVVIILGLIMMLIDLWQSLQSKED